MFLLLSNGGYEMSRNKNRLPFKKWTAWNNVPDKPADADCISKPGDLVAKICQVW